MAPAPRRGDLWLFDPDPGRGREQQGVRPCVILSMDWYNVAGSELVMVVPITTRDRGIPVHVSIPPVTGGLRRESFALCDQLRTITTERLLRRLGALPPPVMAEIDSAVRNILGL